MVAKVGLLLPASVGAFRNLSVASGGRAGTTRYWDCSGGSCGFANPADSIACPNSDCSYPWGEPKCSPHDWAPRWMKHEGESILYAAAAASDLLYCGKGSDCQGWGDGATCGKCYLLTNPGGCSSGSPKLEKMIVRVSNLCPGNGNTACKDQYHFDISAPGFDFSGTSTSNVCTNGAASCDASVSGSDACANGSIEDCDCSKVSSDPTLVEGCENFKLLGWDNCEVDFQETACPTEPAPGPGPSTTAPVDPTTQDPTTAPVEPTTQEPTTVAPVDPTTQEPTTAPVEPTTQEPTTVAPVDPTTPEPTTVAPVDPTTPEPTTVAPVDPTTLEPTTVAPVDPTTQEPTTAPVEPTTTSPVRPTPSPQRCRTCLTFCAPCKDCTEGPDGSFAYGSCEKCWHCWDWDDDELEDDDKHMDKDCDAMHKDHDWDDDEVRCLTDDHEDCRACWAELGETSVFV